MVMKRVDFSLFSFSFLSFLTDLGNISFRLFFFSDFRNLFFKVLKQETAVPVAVPVKVIGGDQSKEKEEYPTHLSVRMTHLNTYMNTQIHTQTHIHTHT